MTNPRDRRGPAGRGEGPGDTGHTQQRATGVGTTSALAEPFDAQAEDAYWRENFHTRPYARNDWRYEDIEPAYRFGWESRTRFGDRSFDQAESALERDWSSRSPAPRLTWESVKNAVRDAWHRVEHALPGDADRDGR